MKIKIFVVRKIQYFEIGIFSFNSYVYELTLGFITLTNAFNLLTPAFNLPAGAFNLATRAFSLLTRAFELVTRRFELVTRELELATRGFELVTRSSCFTFSLLHKYQFYLIVKAQSQTMNLVLPWKNTQMLG